MSKLSETSRPTKCHSHAVSANNLTHNEVRKTVSEGLEEQISALKKHHPGKRLFELAFFPTLYVLGALTIVAGTRIPPSLGSYLVWGFGSIIAALALNSIVLLLHEGMHSTLLVNERINRWVSVVLGSTVLMSFTAYQVMHLRHHKYLGDPRDPDDYQQLHPFTNRSLDNALHPFSVRLFALHFSDPRFCNQIWNKP